MRPRESWLVVPIDVDRPTRWILLELAWSLAVHLGHAWEAAGSGRPVRVRWLGIALTLAGGGASIEHHYHLVQGILQLVHRLPL
jgi:hypothetical protein